MMNPRLQKALFGSTRVLTQNFPRAGSRFLDATVRPIVGNAILARMFAKQNAKKLRKMSRAKRFLIVPDTHIGDSIMMQSGATAIRDFYPDAEIDYVIHKAAVPLIDGNPEITRAIPLYSGGLFPKTTDLSFLKDLARSGNYDLIVNLCAFIPDEDLAVPGQAILNIVSHSPNIISNENNTGQANHFMYQTYRFLRDALAKVATPVRPDHYPGGQTRYPEATLERAAQTANELGIDGKKPVIMLNPDTASPYTMVPFETQVELLKQFAALDALVLIGEGVSEKGMGIRLQAALPESLRQKTGIVPATLPLDVYSALIDYADVYVTGDTGPMHIAATRKVTSSQKYALRNRTAVVCIFGATPSRMSGYDQTTPGYLPANQEVPAFTYTPGSPCRNITCLNKMFMTCKTIRCFEVFDIAKVSGIVAAQVRSIRSSHLPEATPQRSSPKFEPASAPL